MGLVPGRVLESAVLFPLERPKRKRFAKLAKEKHVFYVPDLLDGIHPNAQGYRQFAERMEKELQPYLAGLR